MADIDVQQLAARVQRLEDIEAIKLLIVRYAQGADRGNDTDIMLPLFADDGVWDGGNALGYTRARPPFVSFLPSRARLSAGRCTIWSRPR